MKNKPLRIQTTQPEQDSGIDGSGVGLILFAAAALWLLLFQSNIFN